MEFVAQAEVQGEVGGDLPIILAVEGVGVADAIHGGFVDGGGFGVVGIALKEGGVGVADGGADVGGAIEDIPAAGVVTEDVVVVVR